MSVARVFVESILFTFLPPKPFGDPSFLLVEAVVT